MVNLTQPRKPPSASRNPLAAAEFLTAAHALHQLPPDRGAEVAFAGRSNAGKSTALNALTGKSHLARISKTPGRTQQLVVFAIDGERRLVDLPGYGYAKVAHTLREHWRKTLADYFLEREVLTGLLLAMDVRHPLTEFDRQMLGLCATRVLPCHIILTKSDKLSRMQGLNTLRSVRGTLERDGLDASVQLFSALKRDGIDEARAAVCGWLSL